MGGQTRGRASGRSVIWRVLLGAAVVAAGLCFQVIVVGSSWPRTVVLVQVNAVVLLLLWRVGWLRGTADRPDPPRCRHGGCTDAARSDFIYCGRHVDMARVRRFADSAAPAGTSAPVLNAPHAVSAGADDAL